MSRHLFVERRAYHRSEEVPPAVETEQQQQDEHDRQQAIHDEVAELEESSNDVLDRIDAVLAAGVGYISLGAA